jgi:hypothetical protein
MSGVIASIIPAVQGYGVLKRASTKFPKAVHAHEHVHVHVNVNVNVNNHLFCLKLQSLTQALIIPDLDIEKINLRTANTKGPHSGQMNLAGPFKARTNLCMKMPSRQRRMSSSVADAMQSLLFILCQP